MIEFIIISLIIGICSSMLSSLIDFSFNEDNIFDWYYLFILEKIKPKNEKLFKIMGGCVRCFNVWFTLLVFMITNSCLFGVPELLVIFSIAFSDLTNKILNKYE